MREILGRARTSGPWAPRPLPFSTCLCLAPSPALSLRRMIQSLAVSMQANLASVKNPPTKETPSLAKAAPLPLHCFRCRKCSLNFQWALGIQERAGGRSALQSSSKALLSPGSWQASTHSSIPSQLPSPLQSLSLPLWSTESFVFFRSGNRVSLFLHFKVISLLFLFGPFELSRISSTTLTRNQRLQTFLSCFQPWGESFWFFTSKYDIISCSLFIDATREIAYRSRNSQG